METRERPQGSLLETLLRECPPRSQACIRAAWRYVIMVADPCGVGLRAVRMMRAERDYLSAFIAKFGPPPRCDLAQLVRQAAAALRAGIDGAALERAVQYARILRAAGTTYRVAAAAGIAAAALEAGLRVSIAGVAATLNCTEVAVREALRRLRFAMALRR